ncbi:MAG: shikimate kinase [Bacteroidetes bacterium]|nr:shikimate kinase [Bacteroidota bacterium]
MAAEKIFLIGLMGSGKSYWAKKMGKWIKSAGYDLDDLIVMNEEKTIAEIFAEDGEDYFRKTESKLLKWFKEKKKYVLATGGGAPCFNDNMQWMKKEGVVIWLDESVEILVQRLIKEKAHRPLIANLDEAGIAKFLQQQLVNRFSFYQQAHYRLGSDEIVESVLKKLIQKHVA